MMASYIFTYNAKKQTMRKTILFLGILTHSIPFFSQDKQVDIIEVRNEKGFVLNAINYTDLRQKITLEVTATNLIGYKKPITKFVAAKDTIPMINLFFINGKRWGYTSNYTYIPRPTETEIALQNERLKEKTLKSVDGLKDGIVLFYRDGCPRCAYATTYMLNNNIEFKMLDATGNENNNRLMWDLIQLENPEMRRVQFPVFLINGDISYNIEDLKGFATTTLFNFK